MPCLLCKIKIFRKNEKKLISPKNVGNIERHEIRQKSRQAQCNGVTIYGGVTMSQIKRDMKFGKNHGKPSAIESQ
jgi:hypothetical protein